MVSAPDARLAEMVRCGSFAACAYCAVVAPVGNVIEHMEFLARAASRAVNVIAAVVSPELLTVVVKVVLPHPAVVGAVFPIRTQEGRPTVIVSAISTALAQANPTVTDVGEDGSIVANVREVECSPTGAVVAVDFGIGAAAIVPPAKINSYV